jgi:hypothetical protein
LPITSNLAEHMIKIAEFEWRRHLCAIRRVSFCRGRLVV